MRSTKFDRGSAQNKNKKTKAAGKAHAMCTGRQKKCRGTRQTLPTTFAGRFETNTTGKSDL